MLKIFQRPRFFKIHRGTRQRGGLDSVEYGICGRHPITVFLEALKFSGLSTVTKFVKYAQSSKVQYKNDSSVSYAASYTIVTP